jgi:hypothetical protein
MLNELRIYFLFNYQNSIFIEGNDRRYAIPKVSNSKINDIEYFKYLASHLTEREADHIFSYLFYYDSPDIRHKNNPPKSELKKNYKIVAQTLLDSLLKILKMLT